MDFLDSNLALPGWVRLVIGFVAVVHALLSARVVLVRIFRGHTLPPNPERVPTAAMVAYGILTANIARVLLERIPESPPLVWGSILAYVAALTAGTVAFTQIVVLVRRDRRRSRDVPADR